ncbi:PucR family transcriptional regulator [Rhodococcus sp. ARC_M6]|uniref:PucR family transcriptional regulator n=1 Tax=Rhodococcus sp. ARC_M6 TaxID=2928852 RepID=UPI001FB2185E|nr:PucR family transcriptional regulator [Rhodococcus sp. ARC_M6]MCJ0904349.1 PucR family transcriptional regulator [Rhodococcus sp. ARC_M6]
MPITIRQLCGTELLSLRVLTGHDQLNRPLTWAHASELQDPTPFLDGGELLLLTGVSLPTTAAETTRFVRTLVAAGIAGIGFGTGLHYDEVPRTLIDATSHFDIPLIEVPLQTPFIAITKAVSRAQSDDDMKQLRNNYQSLRRLLQAALTVNGTRAVVRRVAELIGGWAGLLDSAGHMVEVSHGPAISGVERTASERQARPMEVSFLTSDNEDVISHPLLTSTGKLMGYLVAGCPGAVGSLNQGIVIAASSLLTLMTTRARDAQLTMNQLRSVAMHQLFEGQNTLARDISGELWGGFPVEPFQVFHVAGSSGLLESVSVSLLDGLSRDLAFGITDDALTVVVSATDSGRILARIEEVDVTVGVSDVLWWEDLSRARRQAAQAAAEASSRDLRSMRFAELSESGLSAFLDQDRSTAFAAAHLRPLLEAKGGSELYRTLAMWLAHNGVNDTTATALNVHRHTLRSRLSRIEVLLGLDLGSPTERAELWLEYRLLGDAPTA